MRNDRYVLAVFTDFLLILGEQLEIADQTGRQNAKLQGAFVSYDHTSIDALDVLDVQFLYSRIELYDQIVCMMLLSR